MCRNKEQGGRRCPGCTSQRARAKHNLRRRQKPTKEAIVPPIEDFGAVSAFDLGWFDDVLEEVNGETNTLPVQEKDIESEQEQIEDPFLSMDLNDDAESDGTNPEQPALTVAGDSDQPPMMDQHTDELDDLAERLDQPSPEIGPYSPSKYSMKSDLRHFGKPDSMTVHIEAKEALEKYHLSVAKPIYDRLNMDEREALDYYSGPGYEEVNEGLRNNNGHAVDISDDEVRGHIRTLDDTIEREGKMVKPMVVYRGINLNDTGLTANEWAAQLVPGSTISDDGYWSASMSPSIAKLFASARESVVFEIVTNEGMALYNTSFSLRIEVEVLLPRGSSYTVLEVIEGDSDVSMHDASRKRTIVRMVETRLFDDTMNKTGTVEAVHPSKEAETFL